MTSTLHDEILPSIDYPAYEVVRGFIKALKIPCQEGYMPGDPGTYFQLEREGDHGQYDVLIYLAPDHGQLWCAALAPVTVPARRRRAVAEYLQRVAWHHLTGSLVLDFESGRVLSKAGVRLMDAQLTTELLSSLLDLAVNRMDWVMPGLCQLAEGRGDPAGMAALAQAMEQRAQPDTPPLH